MISNLVVQVFMLDPCQKALLPAYLDALTGLLNLEIFFSILGSFIMVFDNVYKNKTKVLIHTTDFNSYLARLNL